MTPLEWFAAAGMPLILLAIGLAAWKLNEWDLKRRRRERMHPGE